MILAASLESYEPQLNVMRRLAILLLVLPTAASADIISFDINQTYTQGYVNYVADLPSTIVSIGGAGTFTLDPGLASTYFDFDMPGTGAFCTSGLNISNYWFLASFDAGESIGIDTCRMDQSGRYNYYAILVNMQSAGVWSGSHSGFLGFKTSDDLFGWIQYDFTRNANTVTLEFLSGSYNNLAGDSLTAGESRPVPEPGTLALLSLGLLGLGLSRRKKV